MGSPLAQTSVSFASQAWRNFDDISILQEGNVQKIQGKVTAICMASRIATYQDPSGSATKDIPYDFLVVATGTQRSWPIVPRAMGRKEHLQEMAGHIRDVRESKRVVVVGGGEIYNTFQANCEPY